MIVLGLNQNKIKEIKYEVKEGKTVIFKLQNSKIEDVEIISESKHDDCISKTDEEKKEFIENLRQTATAESAENECSNKTYAVAKDIVKEHQKNEEKTVEEDKCEKFSLECLDKYGPKKHLDDYEPISCLRGEKGMQEALEASRRKMWKKDVMIHPSKGTPTGNAIIKIDDNSDAPLKPNETKKAQSATIGEIMAFNINQKNNDSKSDIEYRDKIEKKLAKDLINSKMLIDNYVYKMSNTEKEAFSKRIKEKYFNNDEYDEFSNILSLNRLNSTELDENEKKTLDASKNKEWEEDIKNHEINPNVYKIVSLDEKYKDASKEEKEEVSREIIQKDAKIDTDIIKERSKDRAKDEYYKGDPNDEYSKIKSFGDVDVEKTEFVDFLKDAPVMPKNAKEFLVKNGMKHIGQMKIDRKTDEIIDFKPNDNNKNDE